MRLTVHNGIFAHVTTAEQISLRSVEHPKGWSNSEFDRNTIPFHQNNSIIMHTISCNVLWEHVILFIINDVIYIEN